MAPQHVESFDEFYRREYRAVLALAYVLTGNAWLAEELTQEAFLAGFRSWDTIDNPPGWVRTVLANKSRSRLRRRYAELRALARMGTTPVAVVDRIPAETDHFWAEVRRLPSRQAQALALHYIEDCSAREGAAILGCSESTFREHVMRGRRRLADRLGLEEEQ